MLQRTKKQLTYGISLVAILAVGIWALAFLAGSFRATPQPSATPAAAFTPLILEATDTIAHPARPGADTSVDIVARLRNPNPTAGVSRLTVTFIIKAASGGQVQRIPVETYIMPGAVQYVMALNVSTPQPAAKVEVNVPSNPTFIGLPPNTNPPMFSAFARTRSQKTIGENTLEEQIGIVKNTSTFAWEKVEVYVVGQNSAGRVIAAGKTFVGALRVGEEREFSVSWPPPAEPIERVVILPATNMFQEENIIRTIGNPGLLQ